MNFEPSLIQNSIKLLPHPVMAEIAEVAEPFLRVKYGKTTWRAKRYNDRDLARAPFIPGQQIKVIGIEGMLTMLIQA
jgi:membrane protein implicated in regulation of membrane protease activity